MHGTARMLAAGLALGVLAGSAQADGEPPARFDLDDSYAAGIREYDLDADTELLGWRLNARWFVGREEHRDTLSLVWQGDRDRLSISVDEIRFSRRF